MNVTRAVCHYETRETMMLLALLLLLLLVTRRTSELQLVRQHVLPRHCWASLCVARRSLSSVCGSWPDDTNYARGSSCDASWVVVIGTRRRGTPCWWAADRSAPCWLRVATEFFNELNHEVTHNVANKQTACIAKRCTALFHQYTRCDFAAHATAVRTFATWLASMT